MANVPLILATPTLSGIPNQRKQQIIQELDVPSRLIMRKVSKIFREIADLTPFSIDLLHLELHANGRIDITADDFLLRYWAGDRGRFAQCGSSRHRSLGNMELIDAAMINLKALISTQTVTIKELKITEYKDIHRPRMSLADVLYPRENVPVRPEVNSYLQKLQSLLVSLGHPLKVHNVYLTGCELNKLADLIFPYLDPATIKAIRLNEKSEKKSLSYSSMYQYDVWRAAKSFIMLCRQRIGYRDLSFFTHFHNVHMKICLIGCRSDVQAVQEVVQILHQNPNLDQFVLHWPCSDVGISTIQTHFGLLQNREAMFDYPNSVEKLRFTNYQDIWIFRGPKYVKRPLDIP